ncbi:VOC family protein [Paludibacterium purpuratum]|uniref:Glyoxalase/bleomycin resistance protein/dioxygenase superfamily protein n=1 Tax=Paludibacterium purpuratum TaxID=1144873 RepID=A0A4R7B5S7_9NEIS|nr:VOC family protein [Paludibacterium purpuratum]TDR80034.1 glyoxalase/bleomycin resistance protein/dioxygenase superfamily protein [Paludibacterium purpuratum]
MLSLGKIDHIHICVSDAAQAIAWYQRVLGLNPDPRYRQLQDEPHATTMLANPSGTVRFAVSQEEATSRLPGSIAFVVSGQDFLDWIDRLASERVTSREGVTIARDSVCDHHFFCSISFVDPFGNPFEIVSYDHTWLVGKLKLARTSA